MNKKYEFDTEKGIFTLYDPETGKDWSNHFFNGCSYVTSVTHFGVPFSRYIDEKSVQVTLNCPLSSFLYLRDADTKKYWNTAGYPSLRPVKNYRCEHGQQFTRISSECEHIASQLTFAVSPDDTREVWRVSVRNMGKTPRTIDVFAVTAFDLNGYAQPVYYSAVTTSATEYVAEANAVYVENRNPYRPHARSSGYIACSGPVFSYDGNYEKFVGTMGTTTKPVLLEKGLDCTRSLATVRQRGGILQCRLCLRAGEEKELYFILGLISSRQELIDRMPAFAAEAAHIVQSAEQGESRFGNLRIRCPEPQFERILNFWAEHQVSYCMLGKKAVRDNAQLGMAMLDFNVALAKKTIDECVAHQYADGHATLTWYPYPEPNVYSDPSAWLVYAICAYVKESGDTAYLDTRMPYLDGGDDTVLGHIKRAVEWFRRKDNYGAHGLPKIHHADWNDALNIPDENAESVLMAMFVCKVYDDTAELCEYIGDTAYAAELRACKRELAATVNAVAYNGEYYVRAFSRFGTVGDKTCENGGKIYVNPQSWSILSGVCPPERQASVVAAIDGMETEKGIPMCAPPYAEYDEKVGRMSGMLPGVYENGGVYNHAACFKVMADCRLSRGENAVNTLKKVMPDGSHNPSSVTTAEPYVFTNCYLTHPSVDMKVGFSWQTGTSAWGLMCVYEGIFGIRREYDGLTIAPCFPREWKRAEAWRNWRGARLHITYTRGKKAGVLVDGQPIAGDKILPFADGKTHEIAVVLCENDG